MPANEGTAAYVLLVDDDERQLLVRSSILELYGYTTFTATGASEAMLIAAGVRVDLAVVDYHMPGKNGCMLASVLKQQDQQLKTILLSAALSIPTHEMHSIDRFVPKTATVPELLETIASLLPGKSRPTA